MSKHTGLHAINPAHICYLHCNLLYNGTLMPHYYPLSKLSSVHKFCDCNNHRHQSVVVIVGCLPWFLFLLGL